MPGNSSTSSEFNLSSKTICGLQQTPLSHAVAVVVGMLMVGPASFAVAADSGIKTSAQVRDEWRARLPDMGPDISQGKEEMRLPASAQALAMLSSNDKETQHAMASNLANSALAG